MKSLCCYFFIISKRPLRRPLSRFTHPYTSCSQIDKQRSEPMAIQNSPVTYLTTNRSQSCDQVGGTLSVKGAGLHGNMANMKRKRQMKMSFEDLHLWRAVRGKSLLVTCSLLFINMRFCVGFISISNITKSTWR